MTAMSRTRTFVTTLAVGALVFSGCGGGNTAPQGDRTAPGAIVRPPPPRSKAVLT
jgi:hypothetical protein